VLGVRRPELQDVDGVELHGEIYNVFAIAVDTITRIEDYADRDAALAAAGLADS
jgi:glycerol-3-phosphate dehydrogenase